ncbi:urease subunit beta [Actinoallomurus oryzae]|uniref:Urease subunit beta n=1 Tax=Actinoallomurus oryzae TaxID=502180 RepID=A0ABP8R2X6_9ACTN
MTDGRGPSGSGGQSRPASGKGAVVGLTRPGADSAERERSPGQIIYGSEPVVINAGRAVITLAVINTADRPVSVGSHYHFAEANPALSFDRKAAWGHRLDIIAGGMVRFDPGATVEVRLVRLGGRRIVRGLRGECGGRLDG